MKPLASLLGAFCLLFRTACCFNATDLEVLRDLWFEAIRKNNETMMWKSNIDDNFNQLTLKMSMVKRSEIGTNVLQDMRSVVLQNSYQRFFGNKIGIFTNYCGPGNVHTETVCGIFNGVDECCRAHDSCDHLIVAKSDFKQYPKLPEKQLYFTSLSCDCDAEFYNCLKRTNSIFGDLILSIYSVAQMSCFQRDYKAERCTKYDE